MIEVFRQLTECVDRLSRIREELHVDAYGDDGLECQTSDQADQFYPGTGSLQAGKGWFQSSLEDWLRYEVWDVLKGESSAGGLEGATVSSQQKSDTLGV